MSKCKYIVSPTKLDAFSRYLDSELIYNKFYSEKMTEDEFNQQALQDLLDTLNRVPLVSEVCARGTALNNIIDDLVQGKQSTLTPEGYCGSADGFIFEFDRNLCELIAEYYRHLKAVPQYYCTGEITTKYGVVQLEGYIDYFCSDRICDLKTTKQYQRGNYFGKWQRYVYPYCICKAIGAKSMPFEFNITDFKGIYSEDYVFNMERDTPVLINILEHFIEFLECEKASITNDKLFNYARG